MKKKVILFLFLAVLSGAFVSSANLLYYENFDNQNINQPSVGSIVTRSRHGSDFDVPYYTIDNPGLGNEGYSFGSGIYHDVYLTWNYYTNWPTEEMYVSFYMRYPSFQEVEGAYNYNLKFFYPHWAPSNSYTAYSLYGTNTVFYSAVKGNVGMLPHKYYHTCPGMTDGNWHRYEFYVHFSKGISTFWYDGNMIFNQTTDDNWGYPISMYYLTFGAQDSENQDDFTRLIDEIEVWDGMPTAQPQDTIPPTQPTNLIANPVSSSTINLSWTASTDNVGVAGYQIYRCEGTECTPITLAGTSQTNNFLDTNLNPATTYSYRVRAYDAAGNFGENSSIVFATTFEQIITVEQMINSYKDYRDGGNTLSNFLTTLRKWILFR